MMYTAKVAVYPDICTKHSKQASTVYKFWMLSLMVRKETLGFKRLTLHIQEFQWGRDFSYTSRRPWGPPSLLYNGYQVFPGVKRPGRGADHPPPSSAEVKHE
jgi:hypothetical protein